MLGLFGKKSGHPMEDIKSAQQLLEDLPKGDALKALQELSGWIDSVRGDDDMRLDNRFTVLRYLEEAARQFERKLTREYFVAHEISKLQENRLWIVLDEYFTNLAQAFYGVLLACRNGDKGASALKPMLAFIAARSIYATMGEIKFAAVRYGPVDEALWRQLAECYLYADSQNILDEPLGTDANDSVRAQLAGALLWWASGTGSLKPLQIHLSERLTAHFCQHLTLATQPVDDCVCTFDLTQAKPPLRYAGEAAAQSGQCYVGLGQVRAPLESLIKALEKGIVPEELNLAGTYDAETVLEVARRLSNAWLSAPPTRRTARHSIRVNMGVVRGYAGLIDHAGVDVNIAAKEGEVWEAEDISATGFRCILPLARAGGVKVGTLLGFRPENVDHWGACIVRRLRRDGENNLDIGVEMLANQVARVKFRENVAAGENQLAVWLSRKGVADETEARLLLRPGAVAEGSTLKIKVSGKQFLLMPLGRQEAGEDYDLMRYRMIEKESSNNGDAY